MVERICPITKRIRRHSGRRLLSLLCLLLVSLMPAAIAQKLWPGGNSFWLASEQEVLKQENGMVMKYPYYAPGVSFTPLYGSKQAAMTEFKRRLSIWPNSCKTTWATRVNLYQAVRDFSPLVDRMVVNPFARLETTLPALVPQSVFSGFEHPFLVQMQALANLGPEVKLMHCINLRGEKMRFSRERGPSFEEIKWMIIASIGSDCHGLVWRCKPESPLTARRVAQLRRNLDIMKPTLSSARPFSLASSVTASLPTTVLQSQSSILVAVLNPNYCRLGADGSVLSPFPSNYQVFSCGFELPPRVAVTKAHTFDGRPLDFTQTGARIVLSTIIAGGADLLILEVGHTNKEPKKAKPSSFLTYTAACKTHFAAEQANLLFEISGESGGTENPIPDIIDVLRTTDAEVEKIPLGKRTIQVKQLLLSLKAETMKNVGVLPTQDHSAFSDLSLLLNAPHLLQTPDTQWTRENTLNFLQALKPHQVPSSLFLTPEERGQLTDFAVALGRIQTAIHIHSFSTSPERPMQSIAQRCSALMLQHTITSSISADSIVDWIIAQPASSVTFEERLELGQALVRNNSFHAALLLAKSSRPLAHSSQKLPLAAFELKCLYLAAEYKKALNSAEKIIQSPEFQREENLEMKEKVAFIGWVAARCLESEKAIFFRDKLETVSNHPHSTSSLPQVAKNYSYNTTTQLSHD